MKDCCKRWQEPLVEIRAITWVENNKIFTFCPECGSSLKEESKWCECEKPRLLPLLNLKIEICDICHKPIKPKPKLPKKIEWLDVEKDNDVRFAQTINQLIDYLKEL